MLFYIDYPLYIDIPILKYDYIARATIGLDNVNSFLITKNNIYFHTVFPYLYEFTTGGIPVVDCIWNSSRYIILPKNITFDKSKFTTQMSHYYGNNVDEKKTRIESIIEYFNCQLHSHNRKMFESGDKLLYTAIFYLLNGSSITFLMEVTIN